MYSDQNNFLVVQSKVQALLSLFGHIKFCSVMHIVQCRNEESQNELLVIQLSIQNAHESVE